MKVVKTDIIPKHQTFAKLNKPHEINYEALCVFAATGFFLDTDCYYKDEVCLRPASLNTIDDNGFLIKSEPWFTWHYTPSNQSFEDVLNAFSNLFETIVDEQVTHKDVILALSGGLDSRTQATALAQLNKKVVSYSYEFENGYNESKIGESIAKACHFPFHKFKVKQSYLWDSIETLAKINGCYSEFTHPRQMAVYSELGALGDLFSLGHWGDVFFDKQSIKQLSKNEEVELIMKKIVKKGGLELASKLWMSWGLEGSFNDYFERRIKTLFKAIAIKNSSAKIRAFKSMYWAPRWTSVNLSIFETQKSISLPYYDNRMCEFICTIPEVFLADRQLQIAYIKERNPSLAQITWQEQKPYNLYNFKFNKAPFNLIYRINNKLNRIANQTLGKSFVQRNWELQLVGKQNDQKLQHYLFNNGLENLVSKELVTAIYTNFKRHDKLKYSHPLSMLLTLSLWQSTYRNDN